MEKSINIAEPGDVDVLTMKIQSETWIYIAIAPDDKSKISFVSGGKQLILNRKEAELITEALQDCIKDLEG